MLSINACDVNLITVMCNTVNDIVEAVNKKLVDEGITDTYASDSRWYIDIVSHDFDEAEISRCYEYIQEYRSKYTIRRVTELPGLVLLLAEVTLLCQDVLLHTWQWLSAT